MYTVYYIDNYEDRSKFLKYFCGYIPDFLGLNSALNFVVIDEVGKVVVSGGERDPRRYYCRVLSCSFGVDGFGLTNEYDEFSLACLQAEEDQRYLLYIAARKVE